MSINAVNVTAYVFRCDKCNTKFVDDTQEFMPVYFSPVEAEDAAIALDWHSGKDGCFCPDHSPTDTERDKQ